MKKALVLCGGIPQIELIKDLKRRGIYTILADMNPNVKARPYADEFFPISVLDSNAVTSLAEKECVDFVITACADQVLQVQAQVSEQLGLPCYIDYKTAKDVSSKELMKRIFVEHNIPTSKYTVMKTFDREKIEGFRYPLIVKPVDSYSSRGVQKVFNLEDLQRAFASATEISRTRTAIVEEFVEGEELTVDVYVENDLPQILCISNIDKIPGNDKFVICRTRYPAQISPAMEMEIKRIAKAIADAFHLHNSPMLVQLIIDGERISVVEFCARTGGGDKFRLIKKVSGFDVIEAVVDLTLGNKPHVEYMGCEQYIVNEFLYARNGILDHFEGIESLIDAHIVEEFYALKPNGAKCGGVTSSGDRIAYFTVQDEDLNTLLQKHEIANNCIKAIDNMGHDLLRHDVIFSIKNHYLHNGDGK